MNKFRNGAVLIGIGMGGFMDGIVFHQIMQWHNMLSNKIPPVTMSAMKYNIMWDGFFHLFTWVITITGILIVALSERPGN